MCDKTVEFKNPDNLPVENVTLTVANAGVVRQVKALDPYWVEKRELINYERPPPIGCLVRGAVDAWLVRMQGYLDDVKWLLRLEHFRFWSTILYHPQCMDSLVSFLQEANPPYLPPHESAEVEKLYGEIRRHVLIVFCRLITNKESKACWMTKEFMADLIYDKFIFTIPILWDICLVYGVDNSQHVSRMLNGVFTLQPQYQRDAMAAVAFVNEAFKYIILQVNKHYDSDEPPNLPETFKGFSEIRRPTDKKVPDKMTFEMLRDLIIHLLDTTMTLRIFIQVYPKSVEVFRKTNFVNSIVQLYEYGIPPLYEKLQELGDETSISYPQTEEYIEAARAEIIDTYREILAVYKSKLFSGEGNIASHVEDYLTVMMDGLSEKLLIQDYHACYPVHEDIELLRQAYPEIDTVKTDFILQAIYSNLDELHPEHLLNGFSNGDAFGTTNHESGPSSSSQSQLAVSANNQSQATVDIPDDVKRESLISEVRDIFPHLGDGFILKCLEHYGFNSERVINSILEGNLAEPLKALDQSMPIIPEDPLDNKFLETGISRLNVFDGDEFDIMTRDDVDTTRIHVGKKKGKYRDLKDMLDDKSEVKKLADVYSKYNMVYDEVEAGMYSDEYDDTYDSDGVAPAGDGEEARRPFVTPRVLGRRQEESQQESESSEEDESTANSANNKSRMDFCVNPEEMRARREAAWQARRGKGHRPPPAKNLDVTGKPKGQGQEKEVLVNRDKKEKHKSARGNHNRRQGAQWKRSQGMMPS